MKRWQGSQGRIKGCERERLREEKVQSIIRELENLWMEMRKNWAGRKIVEPTLLGPPVKIFCTSYNIVKESTRI